MPLRWILIVHSHSSISDICSSGRKMQQTYQTYSNEDVFRRHRQSVESTSDKATDRIIVVGVKELVFHILKPNHGGLGLWKMPEICFGWGRLGAHLNLHTFARGLWEHHPSLICGLLRPERSVCNCVCVCAESRVSLSAGWVQWSWSSLPPPPAKVNKWTTPCYFPSPRSDSHDPIPGTLISNLNVILHISDCFPVTGAPWHPDSVHLSEQFRSIGATVRAYEDILTWLDSFTKFCHL